MIEESTNSPKCDTESEELVRKKLATDLAKAYDEICKSKPESEKTPQMLIEILTLLGGVKEVKLASEIQLEAHSGVKTELIGEEASKAAE